MKAKIQKWGNSLGLRLPKALALEIALKEGSEVEITCDGMTIAIKPVEKKRYKLKELLAQYPKSYGGEEETPWGKSKGEEWD